MLITEDIESRTSYCTLRIRRSVLERGRKSGLVTALATKYATRDILDYGCGKKDLQWALGYDIQNYDPCVEGCDMEPGRRSF
jgi:hypothetical protein